jgi:hypothetical protein
MLLVSELLRWWYGDGWRHRVRLVVTRLEGTIDYFSIDLLVKTLFSPFRQISAGKVDGPLGVQLRAAVDKLFSRIIGALVRVIILLIGGTAIMLQALVGVGILILWGLVPLSPLIGGVFSLLGVTFR